MGRWCVAEEGRQDVAGRKRGVGRSGTANMNEGSGDGEGEGTDGEYEPECDGSFPSKTAKPTE